MRHNVILGREYTRHAETLRRVGTILHFTIIRITTGRGVISVSGKSYNCAVGDLLFVRGCENVEIVQVGQGEMLGYESYAFLPNGIGGGSEILCFYSENRHIKFAADGYLLCTLLDAVKKEDKRGDGGELALSLIRSVLISSKRECQCEDMAARRVARTAIFVMDNYSEKIGVDECAASVGMSRGYISRNFAQIQGIPLNSFIREVRVREAAERILSGEKVWDAASSCGFSTSSGFYKAFEAVIGKTPSEYASMPQTV